MKKCGMMWIPYDWLNKFYNFYMAAVISIISRRGLRIKVCRRNHPNKIMLLLYKPLFKSHLKQLYISKKTERFSYKGSYLCGICVLRHLKKSYR